MNIKLMASNLIESVFSKLFEYKLSPKSDFSETLVSYIEDNNFKYTVSLNDDLFFENQNKKLRISLRKPSTNDLIYLRFCKTNPSMSSNRVELLDEGEPYFVYYDDSFSIIYVYEEDLYSNFNKRTCI